LRKISSVNRDRISTMHVDRRVIINRISNVDRVDAIKPVKNNVSQSNENYLFYSGSFYDQLKELKDHYKMFYLNQQELETTLKRFNQHTEADESIRELILLIEELVAKYNLAIISLRSFEDKIGSHYTVNIEKILSEYQISLGRIGITFSKDLTLIFNASTAQNNLSFNPDYILFLLDPKNGLIRRLFNLFRSVKADYPKGSSNYLNDDNKSNSVISGLLMDERC